MTKIGNIKISRMTKLVALIFAIAIIAYTFKSIFVKQEKYDNHSVQGYDTTSNMFGKIEGFEESPAAKVILFHTSWCGYCKEYLSTLLPATNKNVFDTVASNLEPLGKITFEKADGDKSTELAGTFGVKSYPTIVGKDKNGKNWIYQCNRDNVQELEQFAKAMIDGLTPPNCK
jgi:thiol-disulfide isomerase/thioredoxin